MTIPSCTYRIQFNRNFTFRYLESILGYLEELGVTSIYASPLLQAAKHSDHGYDGIDPTCLNSEVGSLSDFESLMAALKQRGMAWIQDIVPNHLAFDTNNVWLKDVLERGKSSPYALHFDIDWEHPAYINKLMVPFLEAPLAQVLADNKLQLSFNERGFFFTYYQNLYPVNPDSYPLLLSGCFDDENNLVNPALSALINNAGTSIDHWLALKTDLMKLLYAPGTTERIQQKLATINADQPLLQSILQQQHYVLCYFMDSNTAISYRRFFNVNGLICLRIEDEQVFNDYHRFTHSLYERGFIQGLRIDHVDGLKNPREYIDRLRRMFGEDCYIIVEKILDVKEHLPETFDIQGTSGYEFLSYINQVITDRRGSEKLLSIYQSYVPEFGDYETMVFNNKMSNLESYLNGEWDNLLRMLLSLNLIDDQEIKMTNLKKALGVFMASFPVYRAYIEGLPLTDNDQMLVDLGFEGALARHPELKYELGVLQQLFAPHPDSSRHNNRVLFIQRLMQFTGPLAAKGVEDTTFYRYNPLISHNEVGDEPCVLGIPVRQFHEKMEERKIKNPYSFNCTSTHDTKRGEDGRIRINIISELADEWKELVAKWQEMNEPYRKMVGDEKAPIINDEYFLYQALVGGFPEDLVLTREFNDRTKKYIVKALREAKLMSDYVNPNTAYELACTEFVDHLLNPEHSFLPSFIPFVKKIIKYANTYTMVQVIIKTTAPGIPDIYRGCELWDISYVDPDNRRPVDFELRKRLLKELHEKEMESADAVLKWAADNYELGAQKLFVTNKILQLRKANNELFLQGDYIPLYPEEGDRVIIAYLRQLGPSWILVILPLGIVEHGREQLQLILPDGVPVRWKHLFTQELIEGKSIEVKRLFSKFPVAVLLPAVG